MQIMWMLRVVDISRCMSRVMFVVYSWVGLYCFCRVPQVPLSSVPCGSPQDPGSQPSRARRLRGELPQLASRHADLHHVYAGPV